MSARWAIAAGLAVLLVGCANEAPTSRSAGQSSSADYQSRVALFDNSGFVEPLVIQARGHYEVDDANVVLHLESVQVTLDPSLRPRQNITAIAFRLNREEKVEWPWQRYEYWVPHRRSDPHPARQLLRDPGDQLVLSGLTFEIPVNLAHGQRYRIDIVFLDGDVPVGAAYGPWFFGIKLKPAGGERAA